MTQRDRSGSNNSFYGKKHSAETKERLRAARLGKPGFIPPFETRQLISERLKSLYADPAIRQKRSERMKGIAPSQKTRDALAEYFKERQRQEPFRVSRAVRAHILERDGHACRICGVTPARPLTIIVHHINPAGPYQPDNLVTICRHCHQYIHNIKVRDPELFTRMLLAGEAPTAWSAHYPACIECHTTTTRYGARGLCNNCYQRLRRRERKGQI